MQLKAKKFYAWHLQNRISSNLPLGWFLSGEALSTTPDGYMQWKAMKGFEQSAVRLLLVRRGLVDDARCVPAGEGDEGDLHLPLGHFLSGEALVMAPDEYMQVKAMKGISICHSVAFCPARPC